MGRTGQSNKAEYCPVCGRRLGNRAAAVGHYRAHARLGELVERGQAGEGGRSWRFPEHLDRPDTYWRRGIPAYRVERYGTAPDTVRSSLERAQQRFRVACELGRTQRY